MSPLWRFVIQIIISLFIIEIVSESSQKELLNRGGFKGSLLKWNFFQTTPDANNCANLGGERLMNLLNLVCSTAQALNTTARDGCYGCFIRYTNLPQGQQQLIGLSSCATTYFTGTTYAPCATRLALISGSTQVLTPLNGNCTNAFCEFVRCLRRSNSNNIIAQCARETRAAGAVNLTIDNDNIRYYTNITSCILAKTRCNTYNPITGEVQLPGVVTVAGGKYGKTPNQVQLFNALQTAPDGTLRVITFPETIAVSATYCSSDTSLENANWLNNECP